MFEEIQNRFSPYGVKLDYATLPPILYHYTDGAGLAGMLANASVWATEFRYLNDRSEIEHTRQIVREIITSRMTANPVPLKQKLYAAGLNKLEKPQQDTEVYFFSLSEEDDSLSQWRGYARDGCGFTLGFDTGTLWATSELDDPVFGICRVEYRYEVQKRGMEAALDALERALLAAVKKAPNEEAKILKEAVSTFDIIVWNRSVANKHSSFEAEKEWRIFFFAEDDNLERVKVRSRGLQLIPYIEFSAAELGGVDGKMPLKRIGIGPGFLDKSQQRPVESLCRQFGYDIKPYFANAPYRSG